MEVAYRAMDLLRRRDSYGTKEIIGRILAILIYAHTMKVDLPPTIVDLARSIGVVIRTVDLPPVVPVPTIVPSLPTAEEPPKTTGLTPTPQGGSIFEGME